MEQNAGEQNTVRQHGSTRPSAFEAGHATFHSCATDPFAKDHRLVRSTWKYKPGKEEPRLVILESWPCVDCPEVLNMHLRVLADGRHKIIPNAFNPVCCKTGRSQSPLPHTPRRSKRKATPSTDMDPESDVTSDQAPGKSRRKKPVHTPRGSQDRNAPNDGQRPSTNSKKRLESQLTEEANAKLRAIREEYFQLVPLVVDARVELCQLKWQILEADATSNRPGHKQGEHGHSALVDASPEQFDCVLGALRARLVRVDGNGACLYGALLASLWPRYGDGDVLTNKRVWTLLQGVNRTLIEQLDAMSASGTISLAGMHQRYLGFASSGDIGSIKKAVVSFLTKTVEWPVGKGLPRSRWAGPEEIMAAVWYLQEPIFVVDIKKKTGEALQVQLFYVGKQRGDAATDVVLIQPLSNSEAVQLITECRNNDEVPVVLVFDHSNPLLGHFDAVRFNEALYTAERCEMRPDMNVMRERVRVLKQSRS